MYVYVKLCTTNEPAQVHLGQVYADREDGCRAAVHIARI